MTHYHFIGIGGAGLSPIARVLLERGHQVSGSDLIMSPIAQELSEMGVNISTGHNAANITGADVVIRSSAIPDTNVEVVAGLAAGIPVIKRVDFLAELTSGKKVIAVAGTHGKTTTTAMIAWCMSQMGLDPSFVIGGISKNLGSNAHAGSGIYFVIEADEYDSMFLGLAPDILVVTVVEHDHPDCYPTPESYFIAFIKLTNLIKPGGMLVANCDHPGVARMLKVAQGDYRKITYGTGDSADYMMSNVHHHAGCGVSFNFKPSVKSGSAMDVTDIALPIPGNHNVQNAAAALAVIYQLGLSIEKAKAALEKYAGTGRRYDVQGIVNGITVVDDYAHHPTEIRATLSAARCQYPDRQIWVVWQPHTYSRTRELINDFKSAFSDCDHVIVTEIYASREKKQEYSSKEVVKLMHHPDARQIAELKDVSAYLIDHLKPGNVLLVLSAGDADQISRDVIAAFGAREENKQ
ncbi:MAG: UDP-N-acetylmuramate--L-alanine ligase [Anaerolineaceae bacterium]|nr:UDP-N-acetylmuramate--L-alanine ligase [Anaerolineaceae bacterium]